jgi:hypothetical protein
MWALLLLSQAVIGADAIPATAPEQRADMALRRADEGRSLAQRFLCDDESRYRRLLELDERFDRAQRLFVRRFGRAWRPDVVATTDTGALRRDIIGRRDDCRVRDSFGAGITDYENGLLAVQAQFGAGG